MSQNKTVIQGLEPASPSQGFTPNVSANPYARREGSSAAKGTIVPGMVDHREDTGNTNQVLNRPAQKVVQPGKPIVGFLYSVSRTPFGEYWPLQIGRNTIGQSSDCDIVLPEGTISSSHAVIVTRQVKSGVIAAITDSQSTNGTMINGEPIGFSAEECHNGDIITVGNNYELLLVLIDAGKLGLAVRPDFIPVENEENNIADEEDFPSFQPGATRPGGFSPYNENTSWNSNSRGNDGTVGLDGSMSGNNNGGTIPM